MEESTNENDAIAKGASIVVQTEALTFDYKEVEEEEGFVSIQDIQNAYIPVEVNEVDNEWLEISLKN